MLIIVFGLPGTGKTYFASALAEALNCQHINTDMLRKENFERIDYSLEGKRKVYEQMLELARKVLEKKQNLILDGTFIKEGIRKEFENMASDVQTKTRFIEIKAEEEEIRKRVSRKRAYSDADFEVYQKLMNEAEPMLQEHLVLWSDAMSRAQMIQKAKFFLGIK